jgi:hypothetical protein
VLVLAAIRIVSREPPLQQRVAFNTPPSAQHYRPIRPDADSSLEEPFEFVEQQSSSSSSFDNPNPAVDSKASPHEVLVEEEEEEEQSMDDKIASFREKLQGIDVEQLLAMLHSAHGRPDLVEEDLRPVDYDGTELDDDTVHRVGDGEL